ncbi:homeobox protein NOBOX [Orycteropus afer afer]|uniref:Homeobox protein NOBOX n=1 Tax=Orycteropus afer afer TaxID=1230840 RepID=A0A8B7B5C2_ORYAF|nr:homeobox protein NOBOX [Orycteropus afer afer]
MATGSIAPPSTCSYLEELEPGGHQQGPLAFAPAPQPVPPLLSYLHPFPGPVPSSLTPPPLEDTLFPRPYGPHGGPSQGCFPGPTSGQVLLQPPGGSMGPVPWNHPCLPELPLPGPFYTQTLGHHTGAEGYLPDDLFLAPYEQTMNGAPSPGPTALPAGARPLGMGPLLSKAPEGLLAEPRDQLATQDEAPGPPPESRLPAPRAGPGSQAFLTIPSRVHPKWSLPCPPPQRYHLRLLSPAMPFAEVEALRGRKSPAESKAAS